ncbi:hypothetical protein FUAX_14000 [Fulvitalea axinellae]|uniref:Uncharacterized protein n=1 Tax=Fulvitalea axinellae TaxID=1182444 RepID=A0AAU9CG38_9BACT|nr:hypothetical protein FUAX_14000 [Fulvitalea axinellae]
MKLFKKRMGFGKSVFAWTLIVLAVMVFPFRLYAQALPKIDLEITKKISNSSASPGDVVVFTIIVKNLETEAGKMAENIEVEDILPSGYQFTKDPKATSGTYNGRNGLWRVGSLAPQATEKLTMTVRVLATGEYRNVARITKYPEDVFTDPNLTNNTSEAGASGNQAPEAQNDAEETVSGQSIEISILANDKDDDDKMDATSVDLDPDTDDKETTYTVAGKGTFEVATSGVLTFTPTGSFKGKVKARYRVADEQPKYSEPADVTVTVFGQPTVTIAGAPVVHMGNCQSKGTLKAEAEGAGITYKWRAKIGALYGNVNSEQVQGGGGTYEVTVTDRFGNEVKAEAELRKADKPKAVAGENITMSSIVTNTQSIGGVSEGEGLTYSWSPITGLSNPSSANPVPNPSSDTEYTLTVTDKFGCTDTDKVKVKVSDEDISLSVTGDKNYGACQDGATLTATATGSGVTVKWLNNAGNEIKLGGTATLSAGTYKAVAENSATGLLRDITVIITQKPAPTVKDIPDVTLEAEESGAVLSVEAEGEGITLAWSPETHLTGDDPYKKTANPPTTTTYTVTVTDKYGCQATDQVTVTRMGPGPIANDDEAEGAYNTELEIEVLANDTDPDGNLDPSSLTITQEPASGKAEVLGGMVLFTPQNGFEGEMKLKYQICDEDNQCDDATVTVTVLKREVEIPDALTPNNDGKNDMFVIKNADFFTDSKLTVLNTRGNRVYEKEGYTNDWDGEGNVGLYDSRPLPQGTYYYVFDYGDGRSPLKGFVFIYRQD